MGQTEEASLGGRAEREEEEKWKEKGNEPEKEKGGTQRGQRELVGLR